jgi:hemoglobin
MQLKEQTPTLYEWAGGMPVFERLMETFYQKVFRDEILSPIFTHMSSEHQRHVSHFVAEVFGGPTVYSDSEGSHYQMIKKHLGKHLTEIHRSRWVEFLAKSANEIDLPGDPEFRSAFVAYIEWGTRIAMLNSNADSIPLNEDEPMPKLGWGVPGGPYMPEK